MEEQKGAWESKEGVWDSREGAEAWNGPWCGSNAGFSAFIDDCVLKS